MASIESTQETFRLTAADVPGLSYPIDPFLSLAKAQGLTPRHIMPNRRDMYSQNWGLSVQQMLPSSFTMQVGYIGNNAHKILSRTYINLINPATGTRQWSKFGRIDSKEDAGNGNFNALQVSVKRRHEQRPHVADGVHVGPLAERRNDRRRRIHRAAERQ